MASSNFAPRSLQKKSMKSFMLVAAHRDHAAHLDEAVLDVRAALGDRDRLAAVLHLHHEEAADHLLGLAERTVGDDDLALAGADARTLLLGVQRRAAAHLAGRDQ